ncbi:MAG: ribonuclease P protein component [Treponema sp.]|nr:ribonuclease P protein component [Treponema sp.]
MIGEKGSFRFRREEHLKGRKEIKEVFGKGKRYNCRGAKLFVLKNDLPYNRICFTFSKVSKRDMSFWNAVSRNRARRLGREAFRLLKCRLSGGHDLILLVYPETEGDPKKISLCDRAEQLNFLFTKAGLLK